MAQNYSQFSTMIPMTPEQADWFMERVDFDYCDCKDPESNPLYQEMEGALSTDLDCAFSGLRFEKYEDGIWACSEEDGSLDTVADLVGHLQVTFGIEEPWSAGGCCSCSKPRLDEFGGYAVVVHKGKQMWMNTDTWISQKIKEIREGKDA